MAIVYCSENQAVSRVMLVLHWPNVPVSVCKRLDGKYETKGDFVQMKGTKCSLYIIIMRKR